MISGADEDGRVMVEFSEPVGGRRVKMLTPDEINGMLYKEETSESPANAEEAMAEETEPPTAGQEESGESALARIPKDAQTGEPQYTQTDADTAWDAIVEQTEGDKDMARYVAESTMKAKEEALKKLESSEPKAGATVTETIAAAKEHKAAIAAARQELEQWKAIAEVENRRKAEEKVVSSVPAVGNDISNDTVEVQSQPEVGNSMSGNSSEATSSTDKVSESSKTKQGKDAETGVKLSNEIDENGKPLVLAKDGTTTFGIMEPESGLREAPIQLSLGENYVDEDGKNHGYGLLHIEAGHGKQIRSAGFPSVEEFVEEVAKNYVDIREGAKIGNTQTYLLEMTDDHNNTLFVQLSKDGTYWNVNSAGIFNVKYSRRKPKVYSVPALGEDINTDTSEVDSDHSEGVAAPAGNSSKTSASKVSESPETKQEKAEKSISARVKEASADVNTEPTEAQKEAGNYKKGHVQVGAFDITIEQPEGSIRRGTDADGKQWESKMHNTYGYFRGTEGVDGDHIDVFLSNDMDGWNGAQVFVVDQYNPDGTFDEHKVMLGFNDASDAKNNYLANYEKGWENGRRIDVSAVNLEDFEKWIASSHRKTKPFSEYKSVKPADDSETFKGHKAENSGKDTEAQIKHLEEIKDYPGADKKIVQSEIDRLKAKEEAKAKSKSEELKSKSEEKNGVDDAKIEAVSEALSKGDEKAEQLVQGLTSRELSKLRSKVKASPVLENEWLHRVRTRGDVSLHDWMLENQYVEPVKRVSGTFKMTDYIAPKDSPYAERIGGVYHDKSGFAVATDGRILVADKGSYDPKLKGKIIGKDGVAMENKFPDWQEAISTAKETKSSLIDVEGLHRFVAGVLRANKRAYISLRFPDGTVGVFKANRLNLMLRAIKQLGTSELLYTKDDMILVAKSEKGAAMLMGLVSVEDELVEANGYAYPGNTVSYQRGEVVSEMSQEERVLRDAVIDRLRESGMEVITDEEAGQRVLDEANGKAKLSAKKRRALETVSASHDEKHQPTVVSSADGAKILKELDDTKEKYENLSNRINTFIGDVAKALGAKRGGSASEYASFETKNSKIITIRLSNHNAKVSNFDANGETDGISIVVSPKKSGGMTNDGKAHVVEYYYDAIKLRRAEGKPLADIVRSIKQALYSGEFEDTTGLAERQEVNAEITDRVRFFRTAKGEAYGFTVGGKIYIDPKIANTETPIHEYAHLWAAALRGQNPKEWQNIVELMKGTSVWDEVKKRYPELNTDDDIADEVLATYSGRRGAERLREEQRKIAGDKGGVFEKAEAISALERVKQALRKFWKSVADFLHIHYKSAEEVANRVMKDLLDGVDPRKHFNSRNDDPRFMFAGEKGAARADRVMKDLFDDEGKNMRMESRDTDKEEVNIVEATHEHGFKNYADAKQWAKENIAGTYTDAETGGKGEIRISNTAIDKFLSESATAKSENRDAHMSTLRVLPDVIRESIDAEQHPDFKKGVDGKRSAENGVNSDVMIHRLYGAIRIGDDIYRVKVTLKENRRTKETTKAYSYETTKIELLAGQHGDVTMTSPRNSNNSISVANLLKGVEKSDGSGKILSEDNSEENKIIAEAKKNGRYMLAPNGKKSNLNERQWAQVRTKAFKNWFGDWESDPESSSKVVDENREPLVVDGLFLNLKESPLPKMKKAFLRAKELAEMGRKAEKDSGYQRNSTSFAYSEEGDAFLEEYMHSSDSVQALCDCLMDGYTPKPVVAFRYGEIRDNQRSYNYRDNIFEKGVSVMGKVSEMNTKKIGLYDALFGNDENYNIVIGYDIGERSADGEMLLTKASVIGKAEDMARIVKSATENSGKFSKKEDDIRYRTGEKKELRDGRKIEFVRKPTATYNALARHLQAEGIKPDMHEARTESRYMSFEKDGVQWEVRSSDHTKPEYYGEAQMPVELTYYKDKQGEENLSVSVDLGTSGYNIEDMKALLAEIDRLKNDAGEVKESFDKGVVSDEAAKRYPRLSQALGVKSENEVRAKEEAREHAEEARKQEMRSAVEDMAGKLHLNNVGIVDKPAGRGAGRRERAKGMFERSTGRITINIGNCADKRDAVVTLLHEAVAHHGLRKLFGENFETFLDNVYNSANAEIRRIIDKHSHRYDGDKRTATEEYMASLAERTDFENAKKSGWWQRIKDFFLKMLEKIGLKGFKGEDLSDNELRYVLWRSYENLKSGGKDTVFSAADDLAKQNELKVGEFAPDAKAEGSVAALNTRFNNELQQQIDGNLPSNHIYQMGNPGKILLSTGVPDLPIQMNAKRLQDKATLFDHNFELYEVKDLVKALQNPLAVFSYGDKTKAQNIIVPLQKNGKNFIVGLSLNPTVGGKALEINSIRNVFPKDNSEWLNWISQGKALYLDKEKIQTLIAQQRTNLADVEYLDLDSAAKVVENFENPKFESENDALFRDGDAKDYEKAQARETYERRVSTGMFQSREAIQDSMLSLKVAMDAIEEATAGKAKRIEDYDSFENAYLGENRLSSVNQAESAAFAHLLIRPMMEEVNRLAPTAEDRAELIDYMFAKHGLERNAYMRQQAAEKKLAEYKKQNPGTAKTAADFIDAERDYAGLTTLTGEADVSAAEAEAQRMVADYENDYTFHGTWNEVYVCRKKIC